MHEYDQIVEWYVAARNSEVGVSDLAAFTRRLPPRARILDLGCGDGISISRFLTREGFDVVALDSSPEMIARYRANFPDVPTRCERAQEADFPVESFEAVVAWGVVFHLSEAEQKDVIGKVADWLRPGGWFLFTSGDVEGTTEGEMNGVAFPYTSLGVSGYRDVVKSAGMRLETSHHDAWDNHVYVAEKAA
jgi:cyclopropane fatty-acyl-phospholipid synthase-like methyltransferase